MRKSITLFCLVFVLAQLPQCRAQNNTNNDRAFELSKNLEIFASVYKTLYTTYVDDIKESDLTKTAIDAMLAKLDPYTNFYLESDMEDVKMQLLGEYGGIGALIVQKGDSVYISEPYEGLPAYQAGLKAGDLILEVDKQDVKGKKYDKVRELLRGQAGSDISIKISRFNQEKTFNFKRREITLPNVPYSGITGNDIGYIKLNEFTKNAAENVLGAFNGLKKQNIQGLILDLRGNGGGLLNEAVDIVNLFVDKGQVVVSTKGKYENKNQTFKTTRKVTDSDIPIVVLIDASSASASEIVSGALQDMDRAVIMGQRSFGKGLVQNVVPLVYNTQMKVTVSKYYIPSGRCIQAIDYSHRDSTGRASKITDSLRTAFKTKNGRTVYDGYGIEPDVSTEPEYGSNILFSLISRNLIFDYATLFAKDYPEIPSVADFEISDSLYDDFVSYLKDKDYSYTNATEYSLKELISVAQKEKYDTTIIGNLNKIQEQINAEKTNDLYKYKSEISEVLLSEIVVRYYNQKGRVEAYIKHDPEVAKAIALLHDNKQYREILKIE